MFWFTFICPMSFRWWCFQLFCAFAGYLTTLLSVMRHLFLRSSFLALWMMQTSCTILSRYSSITNSPSIFFLLYPSFATYSFSTHHLQLSRTIVHLLYILFSSTLRLSLCGAIVLFGPTSLQYKWALILSHGSCWHLAVACIGSPLITLSYDPQ